MKRLVGTRFNKYDAEVDLFRPCENLLQHLPVEVHADVLALRVALGVGRVLLSHLEVGVGREHVLVLVTDRLVGSDGF